MKPILKLTTFILLAGVLFNISCKKEYSCENCGSNSSANKPPIAVAGPDQVITLPADSISLDGNGSNDPDGIISEWLWTKISGPASFTIIKATDSTTKVKTLVTGTYQFELKVTDNGGLTAKDTVQVIVNDLTQPNNRPPVANAGPDQTITLPTNAVNLDGSASTDPDNNISGYSWTKISGPSSFNIANTTAAQSPLTNLIQGVYQLELKVTDAGGLSSKDTMQVTVNPEPQPPSITCEPNNRPIINAQLIPVGTLSEARRLITIASAGNKIVFAGGQNFSGATSTVDIYNMTTQNWSTAQLSVPRFGIAAIAAGNKIYFAGGITNAVFTTTSRIDIYDIVSNTWSTAELSEPRQNIAIALVGNKILFAGGDSYNATQTSNTVTNKVDIYDMSSNTWSTSVLSIARSYISANTIGNKVYFAGGGFPCHGAFDRIDIYDNTTNTWSISTLSEPKCFHGSIAVGNNIFWAGGYNVYECCCDIIESCNVETRNVVSGNTTISHLSQPYNNIALLKNNSIVFYPYNRTQFDIYDTVSDIWSIGIMTEQIYDPGVISVNNTIYIAGGGFPNPLSNQVWKLEF